MRASVDSRDRGEGIGMDSLLPRSASNSQSVQLPERRFPFEKLANETYPAPAVPAPDVSQARGTYYEHRRRDVPQGRPNPGPPALLSCIRRD